MSPPLPDLRGFDRRRFAWATGLAILFLAAISGRPLLIYYHRSQMARYWEIAFGESERESWRDYLLRTTGNVSEVSAWESHEYHRKQLTEWGVLTHIDYQFQHLDDDSPEYRHLWRVSLLTRNCPAYDQFAGLEGSYQEPSNLARLQIWCTPQQVAKWKAFLAAVDVADYRERYMTATQTTVATEPSP